MGLSSDETTETQSMPRMSCHMELTALLAPPSSPVPSPSRTDPLSGKSNQPAARSVVTELRHWIECPVGPHHKLQVT